MTDRITIPARIGKEACYGHNDVFPGDLVDVSLPSLATETAQHAVRNLEAHLRKAALAAFRDGRDFVVGPLTVGPLDLFTQRSIFEPLRHEVSVKAGPVEPGTYDDGLPQGWQLFRLQDWKDGRR